MVSELLVVFLKLGYCSHKDTIHVYILFTYTVLFIYTVLFTRNGGSDPRILRCKTGNSGVSKATVWFCTCLGKFCHNGDKSLKSLGFK